MEERGGKQNALARLVLCAHLGLAREERRKKLAAVVGPEGRLRTERQHHAVIRVEREVLDGAEGDGELRQPDGLVGEAPARKDSDRVTVAGSSSVGSLQLAYAE